MAGFKLEPGSTVSHFRLEKKLGEGGMGAVYLAEDLTLSRQVAIKFMSRTEIGQQGDDKLVHNLEQRFIREAKSAAAINHPNVCQIYEANFETDNWFIAMELIAGKALADLQDDGKTFSAAEVVQVLMQTVSGLKFAWEHYKIVHRDIKPQNIMLTKEQQVKIVDLGLAKPVAANDPDYEMPELTGAGVPVGTPQYMAPEQAAGEPDIDHRADIFALGVTVYELLTGHKAFTQKTAPMIYMAQMKKAYTPIAEHRDGVPKALTELIEAMLEPNKSSRIGDYGELLQRLSQIGQTLSVPGASQFISQSGTVRTDSAPDPLVADTYPLDHLILNRYKVVRHLGRSRAGIVYLCIDDETKADCAVKSLLPGREFPAQSMGLIQKNFQRLKAMEHPNLVGIRDVQLEPDKGELFVVMDLLRGQNLRQWTHHELTRYGELDVEKVMPVVQLIAQALDNVGARFKLGHGDIKPESIYLVDDDTRVVLLDYGITEDPGAGRIVDGDQVRTPLPSPDYMAPELWRGQPLTRACDQYSLGVTVYEMLSSHLPFWLKDQDTATTRLEVSQLANEKDLLRKMSERVLDEPPPPIEGLPQVQMQVLNQGLAKQGGDRYETCAAFAKALRTSASGGAGSTKMVLVGMAAVAAILVAVIVALLVKQPEPEPGSTTVQTGTVDPADVQPDQEESSRRSELRESARQQAAELADACAEVYARLAADPLGQSNLGTVDALRGEAQAAFEQGEYAVATGRYREAIQAAEEVLAEVQRVQREQAAELKQQFEAAFGALTEGLAQTVDVEPARRHQVEAEAALAEERYAEAMAAYSKGLTAIQAIREQAAAVGRQTALQARLAFTTVYERLTARAEAAEVLAPVQELKQQADVALEAETFETAEMTYRQALETAETVERRLNDELRKQAEALQDKARGLRQRVEPFVGLDAQVDTLMDKLEQSSQLGDDALVRGNITAAIGHFERTVNLAEQALERTLIFKPEKGRDFTVAGFRMEMVWLADLELWAGKYEVTNRQYRIYQASHLSRVPEHVANKGYKVTLMNGDQQPACWVPQTDAVAYCELMNGRNREFGFLPEGYEFRLPTAEEWKEMARCGTGRDFPWGDEWPPTYGNFGNFEVFGKEWKLDGYEDPFPLTCEVDKSGENEWGLFGMAGNVWEWTTTVHPDDVEKRQVFGASWEAVVPQQLKIDLGGVNFAYRSVDYENIGFRVLLAPVKQ